MSRRLFSGKLRFAVAIAALVISAQSALAQPFPANWSEPFPPFRIAGNLYYVGTKGLANFLVTTPEGHILINSDMEDSLPLVRDSIGKLGFKFGDIKILLISHAHYDHDAASATVKQVTGAKYMVMEPDVSVVESGGKADFQYGNDPRTCYPATTVDRVLHDGDEVMLGDAVLVAHLTPGHTKGCTAWTTKVKEDGKSYDAVIVGSVNVNPGYKLVDGAAYPQMAADYEKTFDVLKALPCDLFLGAHGDVFNLEPKYARLQKGDTTALVDPEGYKKYVAQKERDFRDELTRQRKQAGGGQ